MAETTLTETKAQLWKELRDVRAGMLWVQGPDQHPQPMTHFSDEETGLIWFVTASDTDLAEVLTAPQKARYVAISKSHDAHMSFEGELSINRDEAVLEEIWSFALEAWFDGKGDPKLRMLRFKPSEAALWATEGSAVMVGLKMMQAAAGGAEPDIGSHHVINLTA